MKAIHNAKSVATLYLGLLLPNLVSMAQTPGAANEKPPATRRAFTPPVISPEIQPDRKVTFRVRASQAKEVTLSGEWSGGNVAMSKDTEGVWTATAGPLEAGIYGYAFSLDGFRTADPGNPIVKPMRSPTTSILDIPGNPSLVHDFQPVAHGTVRIHEYQSKSLGIRRNLHVYTPPDYDRKADARYPVLYLFHGSGDNDGTWTVLGRAHLIEDNLLAQGKAKPMIIVMPDGHATALRITGSVSADMISRNVRDFERDLVEDLIPFVEANYRTKAGAANRAIAGLSMGGGQSLTIGLNHLDQFAWVGGFSSYLPSPEKTVAGIFSDPSAANQKLKLLWIACGKDDRLVEGARQLSELLKKSEIRHEFHETEGNHSWPVWRRYLADFAPRLFSE